MRFVMQTGFAYSRLVEQTVELLVRLITKQVRALYPEPYDRTESPIP